MKSIKPFLAILLMFLVSAIAGVQVQAKTTLECDSCIVSQDISEVVSVNHGVVVDYEIAADTSQSNTFIPSADSSAELLQYQGETEYPVTIISWNDYLPKNINAPPRSIMSGSMVHYQFSFKYQTNA